MAKNRSDGAQRAAARGRAPRVSAIRLFGLLSPHTARLHSFLCRTSVIRLAESKQVDRGEDAVK